MAEQNQPEKRQKEISKLKRILHWGPSLALSIITTISLCSINCILLWWPPLSSTWATVNMVVYLMWDVLVLVNFFNAAFIGPGHVPINWKPVSIVCIII